MGWSDNWSDWIRQGRRWIALGAAVAAAVLSTAIGLDNSLQSGLFQIQDRVAQHGASGEVVIVELDARSLEAVDRWPWPRRLHAQLVDRLMALGAERVAFDVDFAARSNEADDRAFAASLAKAGGRVILPAMTQSSSDRSDTVTDSLPLPMLRDAAMLAAVNVNPDGAGEVVDIPMAMMILGTPRPSLPAMLANRSGAVGERRSIDYSIAAETVPRLSAVDVLHGRVGRGSVAGRTVLIGATDIRMGDRYPVPGRGVTPGVVIQALAAETMLANRPSGHVGATLILLLVLPFLWVWSWRTPPRAAGLAITLAAALLLAPFGLRFLGPLYVHIVPGLAACLAAALAFVGVGELERRRSVSLTDPATGRPNRAALLSQPGRDHAWLVAARIVNLAAIKGAVGEVAALRLLTQVMDRLEVSAFERRCYRIGDDGLGLLATEADEGRMVETLRLLAELMRTPIVVDGRALDVQIAFGYAPAGAPLEALANADLALQDAIAHREVVRAATTTSTDDWSLSLLGELDRALAEDQIWVAFQPKWDVALGRIIATEALVRWQHPTRGAIRPDDFIPQAEAHGRLGTLTDVVLDRAIEGTVRLAARDHELGVAVNVSTDLLKVGTLAATVDRLLRKHGLPAGRLTLEITESQPIEWMDEVLGCLAEVRALGVRVSVDDYGTGQSTLSYLKTLRADELKIDQSFIRSLLDSPADATLVRSTITLAHELGMKVVAEGVEDARTLQQLASWGCDTIQGYHIARPLPLDELCERLIADRVAA